MKIKIIDLLNMISKGEEVPKILHKGKYGIYEKEKRAVAFYNDEKCTSYYGSWFNWELCEDGLNDEIEVIEDTPKKIEKCAIDFNIKLPNGAKDENEAFMMTCIQTLGEDVNRIVNYINNMEE